jgi:hypothetical protein
MPAMTLLHLILWPLFPTKPVPWLKATLAWFIAVVDAMPTTTILYETASSTTTIPREAVSTTTILSRRSRAGRSSPAPGPSAFPRRLSLQKIQKPNPSQPADHVSP